MSDNKAELDRLLHLAGVKKQSEHVVVLIPREPAKQIRELLDDLKRIADDETRWTEIEINGEKFIATGVVRDLPPPTKL